MGRLITKDDLFEEFDNRKFRIDINWYISDAKPAYGSDAYSYRWPNKSFPHYLIIPKDKILNDNDNKIRVRQWIEINLAETVIVDRDLYTRDFRFHFEHEHSILMFKLAFSDLINPGENKWAD